MSVTQVHTTRSMRLDRICHSSISVRWFSPVDWVNVKEAFGRFGRLNGRSVLRTVTPCNAVVSDGDAAPAAAAAATTDR